MSRTRQSLVADTSRLRYRAQPRWMPPMLATLVDAPPSGSGWVYEPKLDGVRVLAHVTGGKVRLWSRNRKPIEGGYPELVAALETATRGDAVLDGEIVALDPRTGLSSFARLQQRMQLRDAVRAARTGVAVRLYLFDCLYYEGVDLTNLPLTDRKKVLRDVVWYDDPIYFTPHRTTGSAAMYRDACARGAEGIIAKRADSRYVGTRSGDWLKIKCVLQQEFVIGGYTAPQGSREHLGALLVGYYEGGKLRYAGKVGTGYDAATLRRLDRALAPLARRTSPFAPGPVPAGEVHWVTPKLVAQIGFSEWTTAGLLRHPRFLGLRDDKAAKEVRREG
ncbi:MAG TPA: non-homologous end-joining DNA ligase [Gemmatimonadales bacterium]|nr:non-homologous end-joining DNA ligase [Gemmatimonadales bacterium]